MKKLILFLFCILFLSGCGITNEEIVKQTKFCEDNGMKTREMINGFNYRTEAVICEKKEVFKEDFVTQYARVTKYSPKETCPDRMKCKTASGDFPFEGITVACPRSIPLGTKVDIMGTFYFCEDRTARWVEEKFDEPTFDIFVESYDEAVEFGEHKTNIKIYF